MKKTLKIKYLKQSILKSMAEIETIKGEMFHVIFPEIDTEYHELIGNDYLRLRAMDISLKSYIDDLNFANERGE